MLESYKKLISDKITELGVEKEFHKDQIRMAEGIIKDGLEQIKKIEEEMNSGIELLKGLNENTKATKAKKSATKSAK